MNHRMKNACEFAAILLAFALFIAGWAWLCKTEPRHALPRDVLGYQPGKDIHP